jgi:uncharacterized membrane protein
MPMERAVRLSQLTPVGHLLLAAWSVVGFVAEGWLLYQLLHENFTLAAWGRFLLPNVLVLPFAWRGIGKSLDRHRGTLILEERALRWEQTGHAPVEVPYEAISGYWIRPEGLPWLRVRTRDGREVEITAWHFGAGENAKEVVRVLGPRVGPDTIQEREPAPTDPIEAHVWRYYGDPPPTPMREGVRYRYLTPRYIKSVANDAMMRINSGGSCLTLFVLSYAFGMPPLPILVYAAYATLAVTLCLWAAFLPNWIRLRLSANDRFELVPSGLRVIRGRRSWVFTDPRPAKPIVARPFSYGRPFVRYRRGWRIYFFDPRFIEEA